MRKALLVPLASFLIALYLRLVYATSRWQVIEPDLRNLISHDTPIIAAFWHARLAAMPHVFRGFRKSHMLISAHRDGELIARTVDALGFLSVRGSTARQKPGETRPKDKGGAAALRQMIRIVRNGGSVGITPDGPRGPRMRVSPGTIALAQLSGAPLMAVSYSSSRCVRFKSWDRFLLPLPFGRMHVAFAGPLAVPSAHDEEGAAQIRRTLEAMLNQLTESCDRAAGQCIVQPEPASAPIHSLEKIP